MPSSSSLEHTASKIALDSPYKYEPANRRVRGQLNGKWLFDTLHAVYVWEHQYYPVFYIPLHDLERGPGRITKRLHFPSGFWLWELSVGDKTIEIAYFYDGPLTGLVKILVASLDAWYSEDEKLLGPHPKDPYKRIDCLPSSREVVVKLSGTVIAKSTNNVFLHETLLRTRYYLTPTSVIDWDMLSESETRTECPYKGVARYWHVEVGGKVVRDAVWCYEFPTAESAMIQGGLCFWQEKIEVFVDGKRV